MEKKLHIYDYQFESLRNGKISQDDYHKLLEHISKCDYCAEKFCSVVETGPMSIIPPDYLKDQIKDRVKCMDIAIEKNAKKISKSMQLFLYTLRVGATIAIAILMLGIINMFPEPNPASIDAARQKRAEKRMEDIQKRQDGIFNADMIIGDFFVKFTDSFKDNK